MLGAGCEGDVGCASEVEGDSAGLGRQDFGILADDVVELALEVERLASVGVVLPGSPHDGEVFVGSAVALVVALPVAVALLLGVVSAGDDVDGDAALGEEVERGELAGGEGRRDEPWSVGDEELDPLATGGGGLGDVEAIGGG